MFALLGNILNVQYLLVDTPSLCSGDQIWGKFLTCFVQDYLHIAWRYTYGNKYETLDGTKSRVLGKPNKVKYSSVFESECILKWRT